VRTHAAAPQSGTLEKPGRSAAGQTTKNDGLPHGDAGFSFVAMPAGGHDNTLEKPGRSAAGQTTKKRKTMVYPTETVFHSYPR
jgi:hypothetical protein